MIETMIGSYRVDALLGVGGMGEVYRARDTKLNRDVAIKILPAALADDPERLARFKREAQVLASLNHPNVAAIYGLEGQGRPQRQDGQDGEPLAIVMELVEGPTLADRVSRGAIPMAEALPLARQIAVALEVAHEKGIVHRDLKPANIKVTPDGTVKVLDFGLAAVSHDGGASDVDLTQSPTVTIAATRTGVILGTAAYMSPEQASGKPVDKRADIWSYGVVLFEMLTGRRLFDGGETVSHLLADVLRAPLDLSRLPADTPPAIRQLLERCLDRDVKSRLRDIGEARVAIDRAATSPGETRAAAEAPRARPWLGMALAATSLVLAVVGGIAWWRVPSPAERPFMRFADDQGVEVVTNTSNGPAIAISPDGLRIAFVRRSENRGLDPTGTHLAVRALANALTTALPGTDGATAPFFSPDSRWIAFFADGKLKKVAVEGGAVVTLCEADLAPRGGYWGEDGNILFSAQRTPLLRVPATGGTPVPATELATGEVTNRFAQMLPGGQAFLFTASRDNNDWENATIQVQTVASGQRQTLVTSGYFGRYVPVSDRDGFLVYMHDRTLMAAPMDPRRLQLAGAAIPVLEDVGELAQNGFAHLSVAGNGTVVYIPAANTPAGNALAFFDTSGTLQRLPGPTAAYAGSARPSPDGTRVAVRVADGSATTVAVYDLAANRLTRLTFGKATINDPPAWTPDGKHIVISVASNDFAGPGLYWLRADGAGEPQLLLRELLAFPYSFSPDGTRLAYSAVTQGRGAASGAAAPTYGIWTLPLTLDEPDHPKAGKPELLAESRSRLGNPAFSPDGRWIAYGSFETTPPQVIVRPSLSSGGASRGKWQVSTDRGQSAAWLPNGRELVYWAPGMAAQVVSYAAQGDAFVAGRPEPWGQYPQVVFGGPPQLMPDGKRFIGVVQAMDPGAGAIQRRHINYLLNLGQELRRRASTSTQ